MSLHVPPVPLFSVHGEKEASAGWIRKRILFVDDEGVPWVAGRPPWTHPTKGHHRGSRTLRTASSYTDFLGIEEGSDPDAFMPAVPGWRVVEGFCLPGDGPEFFGLVKDVAAWLIKDGELHPVTINDVTGVNPCDADDSENGALVRILGPSDPAPSQEDITGWAKENYKLEAYLERAKGKTKLVDADPRVDQLDQSTQPV